MAQSEALQQGSPLDRHASLWLAGVLLIVFLTFLSTLSFGWVYDDPPQIPGNPDLRWDRLANLFSHHLWASSNGIPEARFYRPLLALWFLLNKSLFGLDPHWFHFTTVLVHLLATLLAFFIARELLNDTSGALLAAAIFGLHPLQVESVSWISAVDDPLAASFCFASFLACRKARRAPERAVLWWALSVAFFALALFVKEVSVVLPAILLVDICSGSSTLPEQQGKRRAATSVLAAYGIPAIAWLLWRRRILGRIVIAHSALGSGSVLVGAPRIVLFAIYRVVLPVRLSPHYDFKPSDWRHFAAALVPSLLLVALALLACLAAKKAPQLWVAYAWFFFPLVPSLNTHWMNEGDFVHDRYTYLSLLGVALLAGFVFAKLRRRWPRAKLAAIFAVGLVVSLAFASAIQSQYWANDLHLFSRAVQLAPGNEWAQLNLGAALSAREKYPEAAAHFVRSYELKPGWRAAYAAGFAYQNSGDLVQAEPWFLLALQSNPLLPDAWFALGQIRLQQQHPAEAIACFRKALAIRPDADGYYYALASALEQSGQAAAALDAYRTELRLHPYQVAARKAVDRLAHTAVPQ